MLDVKLDEETGIAILTPDAPLSEADFDYAARRIDDHIERVGHLEGLAITTRHFPGWESFGGMVNHLRFIRDHHKAIAKVALVTDSPIGKLGEKVASHFVAAEVRHFAFDDYKEAETWLRTAS